MARVVRRYVDEDGIEVEEVEISVDVLCKYLCWSLALATYPPEDPEECERHCLEKLREEGSRGQD